MALRRWAMANLLSLALVNGMTSWAPAQAPATRQVAIVNGEPITLAEVDAVLKARPIESLQLSQADYRGMQKEALNLLIDDLLMQQFLRKNSPAIAAAEVTKHVKELQGVLKLRGQSLDEYLRASSQTEAQLRRTILTALQMNAYLDSRLTEAALRKYYDDNRDAFDQTAVRASHILLRLTPGMTAEQIAGLRTWLQSVRQEIVAGKLDFAEAARKYSQCTSAAQGGDVGLVQRKGTVDESFAQAAFALQRNQISDVVQTALGLHLIKVTERKAGTPTDFPKVEARVRQLAGEEILSNVVAQQRQAAQVKITLEDVQPGKTTQAQARFRGAR